MSLQQRLPLARDHDGNPTAVFEQWAAELKKKGIAKIEGPIRLVADKFTEEGTYREWKRYPIDRWWAAPFGQFALNDSCIDVTWEPGAKAGDPARITIRPDTEFVTVRNESRTVTGKEKVPFQFIRKPGTNQILFRGHCTLKAGPRRTWIALPDGKDQLLAVPSVDDVTSLLPSPEKEMELTLLECPPKIPAGLKAGTDQRRTFASSPTETSFFPSAVK